ncbi:hypothetical protein [Streptomyces sp. NBC_01314]|uniref:hypothetical protein n=1 Tax=Streptomyces sp. NBC_01314 TaxID=2903821 RepID=UPI003084E674|nr:hypothetical protein OG622_11540 [Streptomyces sp. NBC_01314]
MQAVDGRVRIADGRVRLAEAAETGAETMSHPLASATSGTGGAGEVTMSRAPGRSSGASVWNASSRPA